MEEDTVKEEAESGPDIQIPQDKAVPNADQQQQEDEAVSSSGNIGDAASTSSEKQVR